MRVRVSIGLVRLSGCGIPVGALATSGSVAVVSVVTSVVIRAKCGVGEEGTVNVEGVTGMEVMMASNA